MSGTAPLVTIAIPSYNLAAHLPEAIESALGQTHAPVEVIIVDDGSTDDSVAVARRYEPAVRVVERPNGGLAAARNTGLRAARGAFIAFLDADDVLEPDYLRRCLDALEDLPPHVAYAYTQVRYFGARDGLSAFPPFDLEELKRKNFVHAAALMRTEAVRRFGYLETMRDGWEDWDLYLAMAGAGLVGVLVDEPLLRYRQREGSMLASLDDGERRFAIRRQLVRRHRRLYGWGAVARSELIAVRHGAARRFRG